ncbi:hypothetical protein CHS0354_018910 [Potamilus streckersoni]|uniref:Uncharacterized protein n=1 Tax=Potamilus streckersoni TaxID=2493646 RepID=A0AAE0SD91_9BIVA|nr:hypothetical protein CHS0354_018910 [Potamilus streckersoni]
MSGGNFSSEFNMTGVQNSQDQKCDASSISNSESDGKEYVKSEERLLSHASVKIEPTKLETEGNGLGCKVTKNWCKAICWKLKKQVKRIVSSKADTDSSSDESISDEKEIFQTNQQRSLNLHMIKTPSDVTRNKSNKYFKSKKNLTNSGSKDVEKKIESCESVKCKKIPQPSMYMSKEVMKDTQRHEVENVVEEGREVLPDIFQEDLKNLNISEILDSDIKDEMHDEHSTYEDWKEKIEALEKACYILKDKDSLALFKLLVGIITKEELAEHSTYEDWKEKIEALEKACYILKDKDSLALFKLLVGIITIEEPAEHSTYEDWKEKIEAVEKACNILKDKLSTFEDWKETIESVEKACNILKDKFYNYEVMKKKFEAVENACTILKLKIDKRYQRHFSDASYDRSLVKIGATDLENLEVSNMQLWNKTGQSKVGKKPLEINFDRQMQSSMDAYKDALTDAGLKEKLLNATAGVRSEHESTIKIMLYRAVIRNETDRMMIIIDMAFSEAKHLFGLERAWIFLYLLDDELFHFGSAGVISTFVPNMDKSAVRQHVIYFTEHVCDMMNRLMTLLLGCPDSERLQQMSVQDFISLMQSVINTTLTTQTKGGKKLSLKENTFITVNSKEFERALGDVIPGADLDRHGDEVITNRVVDTRLERTQASERRENRPLYPIYFPSDCRLFIHIPTESGSYWHQMDKQRANRIR